MVKYKHDFIRVLNSADRESYEKLLQSAFEQPKNFTVEFSGKRWTISDDYYPVLGLFVNSELIAMMRIEWIESDREFEFKFKDQLKKRNYTWPMGYLAKAATMKGCEGKGFNSVLRYYCLKILRSWEVSGVLGVMVEGSPRIQIMKKMGYQFSPLEKAWTDTFKSEAPVLLAELIGNSEIDGAITYLEKEFSNLISQFNYLAGEFQIQRRGRVAYKFPWMKETE